MAREPFLAASGDAPAAADEREPAPGADDLVAEWVARVVALYPRPRHPVTEEWDASVQGLVRTIPYVPRVATRPLGLLDRFGAVTVGPHRLGLDGKDVEWERVVEIRTEPAWTSLSAEALEVNLAEYLAFLPPVPGRGWVVRKIGELLFSLYLAVLPLDDDAVRLRATAERAVRPEPAVGPETTDGPDAPDRDGVAAEARNPLLERVVTEVVYDRRFGRGQTRASVTAVLLQLALPESTDVVLRTAADRAVPVVHVAADESSIGSVVTRAAQWRETALSLRRRLARRD